MPGVIHCVFIEAGHDARMIRMALLLLMKSQKSIHGIFTKSS